MIAGFASVLGKQARGTVLLEATQQTKHLTPLQADQHTGVSNTQTTRLNPQQHLKPAELLLAHRQHRQGAPPGTPEPGGVSPLSCRGVSSLYCAYIGCRRKIEMTPGAQSRDDTRVPDGHEGERLGLQRGGGVERRFGGPGGMGINLLWGGRGRGRGPWGGTTAGGNGGWEAHGDGRGAEGKGAAPATWRLPSHHLFEHRSRSP